MSTTIILLIITAVAVLFFFSVYNALITKRVNTENAWSQIDVQLKRRHDLIPNLVETVKGYASHEKETLERVIKARNSAVEISHGQSLKDLAQAENMLSGALRQLFALSESYPDLKANQNFQALQEELISTENRISFARQHYNDSVAVYQIAIEKVPGNIVAGFGNFPKKEYFELDAAEKQRVSEAPRISF